MSAAHNAIAVIVIVLSSYWLTAALCAFLAAGLVWFLVPGEATAAAALSGLLIFPLLLVVLLSRARLTAVALGAACAALGAQILLWAVA